MPAIKIPLKAINRAFNWLLNQRSEQLTDKKLQHCSKYDVYISTQVLQTSEIKFLPGRRLVRECQRGRCGGLEPSADSRADGPHKGIWSVAEGTWGSPPRSNAHTACGSPAASPVVLTWPWRRSPSSCIPQSHSPWNAPWRRCTPGSSAPGCRRVAPVPRTAAGWRRRAGWQCTAERPWAAAAQRSPGPVARAGAILWWRTVLAPHWAVSRRLKVMWDTGGGGGLL